MRVAIFFDGKNFYSGLKDATGGGRLDFPRLADWVVERVGGSRLWGAYYYTGIETGEAAATDGQKKLAGFLRYLETQPGYFVRRFPRKHSSFRCQECDAENRFTQEKEVDTTMVAEMLRLAAVDAFDILVLVSGDADHAPAADGVRALGKQVYVASWGGHGLAPRLRQLTYDHIDLMHGFALFDAAPRVAGTEAVRAGSGPADGREVLLRELRKAEVKLRNGYVGFNYFITRWEAHDLDSDPHARRRVLDALLEAGEVEVYDAPDGNKALRTKS